MGWGVKTVAFPITGVTHSDGHSPAVLTGQEWTLGWTEYSNFFSDVGHGRAPHPHSASCRAIAESGRPLPPRGSIAFYASLRPFCIAFPRAICTRTLVPNRERNTGDVFVALAVYPARIVTPSNQIKTLVSCPHSRCQGARMRSIMRFVMWDVSASGAAITSIGGDDTGMGRGMRRAMGARATPGRDGPKTL